MALNKFTVFPLFLSLAQAYTRFHTHCSVPTSEANFVSSPDARGTLDILWSCLFTIVACTWTVLHLNLPRQRETYGPGTWNTIKWMTRTNMRVIKWFLVTVIAPELCLALYRNAIDSAKESLKKLEEYIKEDAVPWTMTHCLFANMGGFAIRVFVPERIRRCDMQDRGVQADENQLGSQVTCTEGQDTPAESNSEAIGEEIADHEDSTPVSGNLYHLNCEDILILRQKNVITRLPFITHAEIQDRSKTDPFVRVITVGQILWLCIQVIVRATRGLAVSQLEIATVAFSVCAVFMYGLSWNMPKGVQVPITLLEYNGNGQEALQRPDRTRDLGDPIEHEMWESGNAALGLIGCGIVFGSLHLVAWNFAFPTRVELILWRSAALFCTCYPTAIVAWVAVKYEIEGLFPTWSSSVSASFDKVQNAIIIGGFFIYPIARLYIIVEMFRTLVFLPPDAYISTWTTNLPSVG